MFYLPHLDNISMDSRLRILYKFISYQADAISDTIVDIVLLCIRISYRIIKRFGFGYTICFQFAPFTALM